MALKDNLFSLVKSLAQGEKAFFVKSIPSNKNAELADYLILFYAIDKMEEYDEDKLKLKLKKYAFVKHLPVVKNYLFNLILKQLKTYHHESSVKNEVMELLQDAEILMKKALYRESYKVLTKAEKIAEKYEFFTFSQDIYDRLLRLNYDLLAEKETNDYSLKIYEKQKMVFVKIAEIAELKFLRNTINDILYSNENEAVKLQRKLELLKHRLLDADYKFKSYRAGVYYYHLRGRIFLQFNDDEKRKEAYDAALAFVAHLESDKDLLQTNLINYAMALNNLIYIYHQLQFNQYEESLEIINKLAGIKTEDQYLQYRIREKVIVNMLAYYLFTKKHKAGVVYIEQIEKEFLENELLYNSSFFLSAVDSMAMIYFLVGEYSKSLKWLNIVLNYKGSSRPDILYFGKILNLMIHYELGNYDHLEYLFKPTETFLKKNNSFESYHKTMLNFFKKIIHLTNKAEIKAGFRELSQSLAVIEKTDAEKILFLLFNFREWADRKASDV